MNDNFVGKPDDKDVKALMQLRQSIIPMITVMNNLKVEMEFRMSRGEAVDWPQIHSATMNVSNYLATLSTIIHGGHKHVVKSGRERVPKLKDGVQLVDKDGTPITTWKTHETTYHDMPIHAQHDRLKALHPVPVAPFPIAGPGANLAATMLRKRLEPSEEEWVEARIQKAMEFAHVPNEWGIEAKKRDEKAESNKEDAEDEEDDGEDADEQLPTKRIKGALTEDDLTMLWQIAHQEVFDRKYLQRKYPNEYPAEEGEGSEGSGAESSEGEGDGEEESSEEEEEFEDVMDTTGTPAVADQAQSTATPASAPAKPQDEPVARPQVHKATAGLPVLPLAFVHKFMTTGEVGGQ